MRNTVKKLCSVRDDAEAGLITGLLEEEGIPFALRHGGAGAAYVSSSIYGVDLLVAESDYERAQALLAGVLAPIDEETLARLAEEAAPPEE
ncbi:MAG TPA: DUF2007 domain-containing protein [Feifaniaceae bacterium]|nr:DUF2007 domain-containing protein [Feifaniaceae bacterium]